MKKIALYCGVLCLLIIFPLRVFSAENKHPKIIRIAGNDRCETAVRISEFSFDHALTAVIASGEAWPDALCGGVLGSWVDGPLLLIRKNSVPATVIDELNRLGVERILLLGGENTLSKSVEQSLAIDYETLRIAGTDRVDTSHRIGEWIKTAYPDRIALGGGIPFYVSSKNFADALSATHFVNTYYNYPGILYLLAHPIEHSIASVKIGGSADGFSNHLSGKNRYETSALLFDRGSRGFDSILLVSGEDFPDGLASAPMSSKFRSSILLTQKNKIPTVIKERIQKAGGKPIYIIGGENTISSAVVEELEILFEKENP